MTCHEWRPLTDFNKRARATGGLQARCRTCNRVWYVDSRGGHMRNTRRRSRQVADEYHRRLFAYLDDHPCVDCGERDVTVLEFDHLDPATKVREVTRLVARQVAWEAVEAEMAKCDVCCANCHRRRTAERGEQRRHRHEQASRAAERAKVVERLRDLLPARG